MIPLKLTSQLPASENAVDCVSTMKNGIGSAAMWALFLSTLTFLPDLHAESSDVEPSITFTQVEVQPEDAPKFRILLSAEGKNIGVGSYNLQYEMKQRDEPVLPGFVEKLQFNQRYQFLPAPIIDNGVFDLDEREGTVGLVLDVSDWPKGRYVLVAEANNRPGEGDYVFDRKTLQVEVAERGASVAVVDTPRMEVLSAEAIQKDDGVEITVAAQGNGIHLKSFFIAIQNRPNPDGGNTTLPGFFRGAAPSKREFFNQRSSGKPDSSLSDNGSLDQNPEVDIFVHTLSTRGWPEGEYRIQVGAHNRPGPGDYVVDSEVLTISVGDAEPLPISNIPSAIHRELYKKEGEYACFASLYTLPSGGLNVNFAARPLRSHYDGAGQHHPSLVSFDDGLTWENSTLPKVDVSWRNRQGNYVIANSAGWKEFPISEKTRLEEEGRTVLPVNESSIATFGGAEAKISRDGGETWEITPIDIPEDCGGLMGYLFSANHLVTREGVRLTAVYGFRREGEPKADAKVSEVYLLRSTDDGTSWACLPMWPEGLPDKQLGFNETTIGESGDGTIIAMMRSTEDDYLWQSESRNGGLTWTAPLKTAIWGFPADLLSLKDGRLLCVYGYRRDPMGIRAVLSSDHGKTWDTENELIIRQDGRGLGADLGYPSATELPDGSVFIVYYMTTDGESTHIASSTIPASALSSAP